MVVKICLIEQISAEYTVSDDANVKFLKTYFGALLLVTFFRLPETVFELLEASGALSVEGPTRKS